MVALQVKPLDALEFLGAKVRLEGALIFFAVAGEHELHGGVEFVGLAVKVGAGAAPGFRRIAGELDAVYREHLAADQALPVARWPALG